MTDTVTYTTRDVAGAVSNEATIKMAVTGTNDVPVANAEKYSAFKGSALDVGDVTGGLLAMIPIQMPVTRLPAIR